ncbi:MAG: glycosyltransferase family 4 protein [Defluviicoccus sp.]
MRIFLHDYSGHPPQIFLSRALAARGHQVAHSYAAEIETPRGQLQVQPTDPKTFSILPIRLAWPLKKHSYFIRQLQEVEFGLRLRQAIIQAEPDVVVCANAPLAAVAIAQTACRRRRIPFLFWVMDLHSLAVHVHMRRKLGLVGEAIGRFYKWLERRTLLLSDRVISISEGFEATLDTWHVDPLRRSVMPLWAPLHELPVRPKDNPWARQMGFADSLTILYSGTLGLKHNPALLVRVAEHYRSRADIRIVVISEGPGADYIRTKKAELALDNLTVLPYQPFEEMPNVLGAADILVTLLEPDAGVYSVPSKVLSYLCAGRAQAAAIPAENQAAQVISRSGGGLTASPLDTEAFVAAVDRLVRDEGMRRQCGANARAYAEREFDINRLATQFEGHLVAVLPAGERSGEVPIDFSLARRSGS